MTNAYFKSQVSSKESFQDQFLIEFGLLKVS